MWIRRNKRAVERYEETLRDIEIAVADFRELWSTPNLMDWGTFTGRNDNPHAHIVTTVQRCAGVARLSRQHLQELQDARDKIHRYEKLLCSILDIPMEITDFGRTSTPKWEITDKDVDQHIVRREVASEETRRLQEQLRDAKKTLALDAVKTVLREKREQEEEGTLKTYMIDFRDGTYHEVKAHSYSAPSEHDDYYRFYRTRNGVSGLAYITNANIVRSVSL